MRIQSSLSGRVVNVNEAIKGSLDGSSEETGQWEDMQATQQLITDMLGVLVEKLHAKDVIGDADIVDLLSWRYVARPDAAE